MGAEVVERRTRTNSLAKLPLADSFGRRVDYLRVSVTDRCDFRCFYCMSEDMTFLPRDKLLTLEELDRLCSAFVARGVRKLRVTGGEPLVRRDVMRLFRGLSRHLDSGALNELTLTTNGAQLARHAAELAACGVRRVNVSLDTLDPAKFRALTRFGDLSKVLKGIDAAQAAGLAVKINVVALRDYNEDEFVRLIEWAHGRGMDLTFIEVMPLGEDIFARTEQYISLEEVAASLSHSFTLRPVDHTTGGPARYFHISESGGRLGLISPLSHSFCDSCNRVRVTSDGGLYLCLGQEAPVDLRACLRSDLDDAALHETIDAGLARKPRRHEFLAQMTGAAPVLPRVMSLTGG